MTFPSLEALRELAPGYLMRTLTPDEQRTFEEALGHATMGPELQAELVVHRAALEGIVTAGAAAPSASLRDRVAARIAVESRASAPNAGPTPTTTPRWIPVALSFALAASTVFAVALRQQIGTLREALDTQRGRLQLAESQLAKRDSTLRVLTEGGDDLVLVRLSPGAPTGPALQLFWNVRSGRAVVHASGLRTLPDGRTYQLWLIRNGTPESVALFQPDSQGTQLLRTIEVPVGTGTIAAFAVTEEPAGGSAQPTMTPFLIGAVQ
jgi:anti-sigma-K factor RskA